jgi:cytochrome d ubiquinol oxidase subunit I
MQAPAGFELTAGGVFTNLDPLASLLNPAWPPMAVHSTLSTYQSVGFATAGIYACALLRNRQPERDRYNRLAILIAMAVGSIPAVLQPIAGDVLARRAHETQPAKLAALEGQFTTQRGAPLRIGGIPDPEAGETLWALEIPKGLSILATHNPDGEVLGLDAFPRDEWPESRIVHPAFQLMIGAGFLLLVAAAWFWWAWFRQRVSGDWAERRRLLRALVLSAPLGFLALEAGWVVTEAGRQPWIIYGIMRTRDAVTPAGGVIVTLAGFSLLYAALIVTLLYLLRRLTRLPESHNGALAVTGRSSVRR